MRKIFKRLNRIQKAVESHLPREQADFKSGKLYTDHVANYTHTLHQKWFPE